MHTITIDLGGQERSLSLDLNATIALAEMTGQDVLTMGAKLATDQPFADKIKLFRTLIWACLATSCHKEFADDPGSLQTVGSWLDLHDLPRVGEALGSLIGDFARRIGSGAEFAGQLAPFVPTPAPVVVRMLAMAGLKGDSHVVDLGAGDGRLLFAAADEGCTAEGYELSLERYQTIKAKIRERQLGARIAVYHKDAREADLNRADAVFLYLLPSSNAELKAELLAMMKPGARVISHDFKMPDWKPDATENVLCEDRAHTVHMWRIPERAALALVPQAAEAV